MHIDVTVVQPPTEAPLMTLRHLGAAAHKDSRFREADTFTTDQSNHHPNQSLQMASICPFAGLTQ
jgi:hypothetical protein